MRGIPNLPEAVGGPFPGARQVADDDATVQRMSPGIKPLLVLAKIRGILDAFSLTETELTLSQLRARTGFPTSTVQRLVANLVAENFLDRDGDRYRIGVMLAYWAAPANRGLEIPRVIAPALNELRRATGETACFFIREGRFRVCVAIEETGHAIRREMHVGKVVPLHAGSAGRVLLAWDPDAIVELLAQPLDAFTCATIVNPETLRASVLQVRRDGWAYTQGERDEGAAGLSAPVFDAAAKLVGAITISGPTSRVDPDVAQAWADDLVGSASMATRLLGGRLPY